MCCREAAAAVALILLFCSVPCQAAAPDAAGLDFNCTSPALAVAFPDPVGPIRCGARSLQKCPTSSAVQTQPVVQWAGAASGQFYTLIMVDPDAPTPRAPTMSPIMHWVAVNIPGDDLATGFSNATVAVQELFPYHGPHPPVGSAPHRYGQFVFLQPTGKVDFKPLPVSRVNWDYEAFLAQYRLGQKLASNYMLCSA